MNVDENSLFSVISKRDSARERLRYGGGHYDGDKRSRKASISFLPRHQSGVGTADGVADWPGTILEETSQPSRRMCNGIYLRRANASCADKAAFAVPMRDRINSESRKHHK